MSSPGDLSNASAGGDFPARAFRLHGLRVRSELPLPAGPAASGEPRVPDATVTVAGVRPVSGRPPPGRLVARVDLGDGNGYAAAERGGRTVLRFFSLLDVEIDGEGSAVRVVLAPGTDPELAGLLLAGAAAALLLALRGRATLHASAVVREGRAVGFVGPSGSGKSTLAALCCASGARLLSDDALRVDVDASGALGWSGTRGLRLHDGDREMLRGVRPESIERSCDGRVVVDFPAPDREPVPLSALVLPRIEGGRDSPEIRRHPPRDALLALLGAPRLSGVVDEGIRARRFASLGRLADTVPVFEARIPRGRLEGAEIADALLTPWRRAGDPAGAEP